jgi:hypothetical protein
MIDMAGRTPSVARAGAVIGACSAVRTPGSGATTIRLERLGADGRVRSEPDRNHLKARPHSDSDAHRHTAMDPSPRSHP